MRRRRMLETAAVLVLALSATACAGLPTVGTVNPGLGVGEVDTGLDVTFLPNGPSLGASPDDIVRGFIEAGTSPAEDWGIATQFLTPQLAETWRPSVAVTIDRTYSTRMIEAEIAESDDSAIVRVSLTLAASVDSTGVYIESPGGQAELPPFELVRMPDGEWRISAAPDGIVLDQESFAQVFRRSTLQYFDAGWAHLVPDARWFPRERIATMITQAVVSGAPVDWLAESVRTAFPANVRLARESVPVSADTHVADVSLTASALTLEPATLARMRTQLERSLAGAGVSAVRFLVDGRELAADLVETVPNRIDPNTFVLTEHGFGAIAGEQITRIPEVSDAIESFEEPVVAIELDGEGTGALVQLEGGHVHRVIGARTMQTDVREGIVVPSLDGHGFAFSVPTSAPAQLVAWGVDGQEHELSGAWPDATAVSHISVAPDSVRIAAIISAGGQELLALAGIVRDADGVPVRLGPIEVHSVLPGEGLGLAWLGDDAVGVLTVDGETRQLLEISIGGPRDVSVVPTETVAIGGANNIAGARLLSSSGVVSVKRGTSWQESASGVLVLATQAGR